MKRKLWLNWKVMLPAAVLLLIMAGCGPKYSDKEAGEIALRYIADEYGEKAVLDDVFLHGGYLGYLVEGHFQDPHETKFKLIVDDDSGQVRDNRMSISYANMRMRALSDLYADELEQKGYTIPEREVSGFTDAYFVAYGCADRMDCAVQELQVELSASGAAETEQAFRELYEWQKTLPERIDSIWVRNPGTDGTDKIYGTPEGTSHCLRPDGEGSATAEQYGVEEFLTRGQCENPGDKG